MQDGYKVGKTKIVLSPCFYRIGNTKDGARGLVGFVVPPYKLKKKKNPAIA